MVLLLLAAAAYDAYDAGCSDPDVHGNYDDFGVGVRWCTLMILMLIEVLLLLPIKLLLFVEVVVLLLMMKFLMEVVEVIVTTGNVDVDENSL